MKYPYIREIVSLAHANSCERVYVMGESQNKDIGSNSNLSILVPTLHIHRMLKDEER